MWYNMSDRPRTVCTSRGHGQPVREVIMSIIPQKRCSKCGADKPLSDFSPGKSRCKACRAARMVEYRREKPDKHREWVEQNRERRKAQQAVWYLRHQEQEKERARSWRQNNPDRRRAQIRAYRKAKPDKVRTIVQRRRARRYQQGGSYSEQEWIALKAHHNYTCLRCGRREPEIRLSADHVVPIARGGGSYIDNIQPLCDDCNRWKNVRTVDFR